MISYCSIEYLLIFLPVVFLGYQILPKVSGDIFFLRQAMVSSGT